jgi:opacity protein-like surface antigen
MRSTCLSVLAGVAALALLPSPAAAQDGFGIGMRFAMVKADAHVETDAVRFTGGQLRLGMSKRTTLELSMDFKTLKTPGEALRTKDRPIQVSLLLYPVKSAFAPYLLGGVGWYRREVQLMDGDSVVSSESTTEFGYHGGFGAQIGLGKHAAIHGDYRYTGLHFGGDKNTTANLSDRSSLLPVPSGLLPGYKGSMWTAGFTVYF